MGNDMLVSIKNLSWYLGEVKLGVAQCNGDTTVYSDRIKFAKHLFIVRGGTDVYYFSDIAEAKESKYMVGNSASMVITLNKGKKHTFVGLGASNAIRTAILEVNKRL